MENRIKLLVIGLGVLAAISLLIAFQLNITNNKIRINKAAVERELDRVSKENEKFAKDLSNVLANNKSLASSLEEVEAKGKSIQDDVNRLKERLDLTTKERDSLIDKVQGLIEDKRKIQESLDAEKSKKAKREENGEEVSGGAGAATTATYTPGSSQEAYWANVLRQKANAELELENVKAQLKEISLKADELFREKNNIEMELKNVTQLKEDMERRTAYNEKLANSLSEDLVREKNDKAELSEQLNKVSDDNRQMRARIKDLEETKTTLYRKIDNIEQERLALRNKLGETEGALTERVNEIVKVKRNLDKFQSNEVANVVPGSRTVELSPIIVRGKQDAEKPALTGRILSINRENKFVIIDLSSNSGLKLNDRFNVYRDGKYIGSIEVIQMRKDISAADIKETSAGEDIKIGDIIKLSN
jgi:chromosome segregation ATPase